MKTTRKRGGFTLIEMMVALAVMGVFFSIAYLIIGSTVRVVTMESTVLDMDRNADQALQELAAALRPAIPPIPVAGGNASYGTAFIKSAINTAKGFDNARGKEWLDILRRGSDCLPFTVPVDVGGDGDFLDADGYIELGMILPNGSMERGADYKWSVNSANPYADILDQADKETEDDDNEKTNPGTPSRRIHNYLEGGSVNRHIRLLNARGDLGIEDAGRPVNVSAPRFAAGFTLPRNGQAYALARFVPFFDALGQTTIKDEAGVNYDFNSDGDVNDRFVLGRMEIVYSDSVPPQSRPVFGGASVLLQLNADDASWVPIFKLIRFQKGDQSLNNYESFDEDAEDGDYGLLIRLLIYDQFGQQGDPAVFSANNVPAMTRWFETTVKFRNLTVSSADGG